jgi:cardiolipin synthase
MNIADENLMRMHPRQPVQDTHFQVKGPVVSQLVDAFADDWGFVTGEELKGEAWFPSLSGGGAAKARVITSGPDQDVEKIEFCVMQAIACARSSIYVMTPYFLPDERLLTALALAAMRGVTVHIVMPKASNHVAVDWAARANIGSLLKDGVNIWLGPAPFRHSKIMVVDGEWSLIGSSNWDMRSFRLNFEICMEVYDHAIAQALQHFVTSHRGEPLTNTMLKARSLPIKLRDAGVRLMMPYL